MLGEGLSTQGFWGLGQDLYLSAMDLSYSWGFVI